MKRIVKILLIIILLSPIISCHRRSIVEIASKPPTRKQAKFLYDHKSYGEYLIRKVNYFDAIGEADSLRYYQEKFTNFVFYHKLR